jgi:hypothetical protein
MFELFCKALLVNLSGMVCLAIFALVVKKTSTCLRKRALKIHWFGLAGVILLAALVFSFVSIMLIKSPAFPIFSVIVGLFMMVLILPLFEATLVSTHQPRQRLDQAKFETLDHKPAADMPAKQAASLLAPSPYPPFPDNPTESRSPIQPDPSKSPESSTEEVQRHLVQLWNGLIAQSSKIRINTQSGAISLPLDDKMQELNKRYGKLAYYYGMKVARISAPRSLEEWIYLNQSLPAEAKDLKSPLKQAVELHQKGQALRVALEDLPITARNLPFSTVPLSDSLATTLRKNGLVTPHQLLTHRYVDWHDSLMYYFSPKAYLTCYETLPGFGMETMDALMRVTKALRQVTLSVSPLYSVHSLDDLLVRLSPDQRSVKLAKSFHISDTLQDTLLNERIDTPGDIQKRTRAYASRFGACSFTTFLLKRLDKNAKYLDELRLILMGLLKYAPYSPSRSCILTAKEVLNQHLDLLTAHQKAVPFKSLPLSPALAIALTEERIHSPGELISKASDYARQWGGCSPADFLLRLTGTDLDSLAELSMHLDPVQMIVAEAASSTKPKRQRAEPFKRENVHKELESQTRSFRVISMDEATALVEAALAACPDWLLEERIESVLMNCSTRLENVMLAEGVVTVGDLADYPAGTLQHIPMAGSGIFQELAECLHTAETLGPRAHDTAPRIEALPDDTASPDLNLIQTEFAKSLDRSMRSGLSDRQRYVIIKLFGLNNEETASAEQIGKELGVTAGQIFNLKTKALAKLMHPARSRELRSLLEDTGGAVA